MTSLARSQFLGNQFVLPLSTDDPRLRTSTFFSPVDRPATIVSADPTARGSVGVNPIFGTEGGSAGPTGGSTQGLGGPVGPTVDPGLTTPGAIAEGIPSALGAIAQGPVGIMGALSEAVTQDKAVGDVTTSLGRAATLGSLFGPVGALVAAPFAAQAIGQALDPLGQFDLFGFVGDRAATSLGFDLGSNPEADIPGFDPSAFGPGFEASFQGAFDPGFGGFDAGFDTSEEGIEGIGDEAAGAGFDPDAASDEGIEGIGDEAAGAGGPGGGDGDGDGDGSVICTELNRQGILSDELYAEETEFGERLPNGIMEGYHAWGKPVAKAMSRSKILTSCVKLIAMPIIRDMADGRITPILKFGLITCRIIGSVSQKYREVLGSNLSTDSGVREANARA